MIRTSTKPRTTPWPLVAMACTALAACGGGEHADAPPAVAAPQGVFGNAPAAAGGTPSVITLLPMGGTPSLPPRESPVMDQLGLAFSPMFLLVRTGETVRFPNSETVAHNVKLTISDTDAVVADYETDPGAVAEHVLDVAGGYEVTCDHHPGMRAFIFVTSAPYATFAETSGAFRIPDVPPGSYTLEVWSVDPTRRSQRTVEVTGPSTEVSLTATP